MVAEQADLEVRHHLVAAGVCTETDPCVIRRVHFSPGMFCHMGKMFFPREFCQVFTEMAAQVLEFRTDIFNKGLHPWFQAFDVEDFKVFFCKMIIWHHAGSFQNITYMIE